MSTVAATAPLPTPDDRAATEALLVQLLGEVAAGRTLTGTPVFSEIEIDGQPFLQAEQQVD